MGNNIKKRLWSAVDQIWVNMGLKPSQFSTPVLSLFLMLVPIIIYVFIVVYFSVNIPYLDDYRFFEYINISDGYLRFQKLFAQHNEHRLVWNGLMTEFCYLVFGKINFEYLIYIGNFGLLLFFLLLLRIFKEQKIPMPIFIPVPYFLFNPQGWENMTWSTASLQNYYVLFFALLTLYLWNKKVLYGYIAAWFFGALTAYTSANGLLILLILIFFQLMEFAKEMKIPVTPEQKIFILKKHFALLIISLLCIAVVFCFYFVSYKKPVYHPSIIAALLQPLLLSQYIGILLGSYMAIKILALLVGVLEIFIFIFLTYKRYDQKNPIIYYFMIFILLSILIIGLGRSGFGIEQALSSRYEILSIIFFVLIYLAIAELYPEQFAKKLVIYCLTLLAVIFNIYSTVISIENLSSRKNMLVEGMKTWEKTGQGLTFPNQKYADFLIKQSQQKGTYHPPGW